jgi:hypothetical protein
MERIHVTVGPQTIDFRASTTVEAVENKIRNSCVLQGGRLELDGLVLIEGDAFVPETTYNFVGGIPLGKLCPNGDTDIYSALNPMYFILSGLYVSLLLVALPITALLTDFPFIFSTSQRQLQPSEVSHTVQCCAARDSLFQCWRSSYFMLILHYLLTSSPLSLYLPSIPISIFSASTLGTNGKSMFCS